MCQKEVVVGPLQEAHHTVVADELQDGSPDRDYDNVRRISEVRVRFTVVAHAVLRGMQYREHREADEPLLGYIYMLR